MIKWDVNLAVFTTANIIKDNDVVTYVIHDADGDWQFLGDAVVDTKDIMIVGLGEMLQFDPSLNEIMDLPIGFEAKRIGIGSEWRRYAIDSNA